MRAIFRLNHVVVRTPFPREESDNNNNNNYDTERQTAAYLALQSLNELTVKMSAKVHPRRMDRCGVVFRLGQVVQHRDERWRGIVVEWDNLDKPVDTERPGGACSVQTVSDEFSKSTMPTAKKYTWTGTEDIYKTTRVRYTVLLDEGDADALESQLKRTVWQSELDIVRDPQLCRIRSVQTPQYFIQYNASAQRFVPNSLLAYQYPMDEEHEQQPHDNGKGDAAVASKDRIR